MLFDVAVVEAVRDLVPPWLGLMLIFLTYLGSVYVLVPAAVVAYWREPRRFSTWLGAIIAYYATISGLKGLHSVQRPNVDTPVATEQLPSLLVPVYDTAAGLTTPTFPSGHTMAATVFMGLVIIDLKIGTRRQRLLLGVGYVVLVAFTRVALGVHFPGDVLAGAAFGLVFLGIVVAIRRTVTDDTTALLLLAAVLGIVATALGGAGTPQNVVGAAIGALAAWSLIRTLKHYPVWRSRLPPFVGAVVVVTVVSGVSVRAFLSDPIIEFAWIALAAAAVVALPGAVREDRLVATEQPVTSNT